VIPVSITSLQTASRSTSMQDKSIFVIHAWNLQCKLYSLTRRIHLNSSHVHNSVILPMLCSSHRLSSLAVPPLAQIICSVSDNDQWHVLVACAAYHGWIMYIEHMIYNTCYNILAIVSFATSTKLAETNYYGVSQPLREFKLPWKSRWELRSTGL
jgi:hypothetical protein